MKIFKLNDCDWWIGPNLEVCKTDCADLMGDADCVESDAYELSNEELDQLTFIDEQDNKRTFREQLSIEVAKGGAFPRPFASTEY